MSLGYTSKTYIYDSTLTKPKHSHTIERH